MAAPVTGAAKAQKAIVVSISQQMLWAYKGDQVVLNSYVSTGRSGFDTPLGSFAVLSKLPSQTMEGVIGGEYYNVLGNLQLRQLRYFGARVRGSSDRWSAAGAAAGGDSASQCVLHGSAVDGRIDISLSHGAGEIRGEHQSIAYVQQC